LPLLFPLLFLISTNTIDLTDSTNTTNMKVILIILLFLRLHVFRKSSYNEKEEDHRSSGNRTPGIT
jgi:hypothetical protein